mmetsp:Transcript_28324/g.56995  ORF Transcript_28324/g.56995 Transcript_28324/m.56995 type:complete len:487 (+) Transcript_28324:70-1530(+)
MASSKEKYVRRSISVHLIRHGESKNNQVYRDAQRLFKGGTPDFDLKSWTEYVDAHRVSDPGLSDVGQEQASRLSHYLEPHLANQAGEVRFVISPMRRTIETMLPTLTAMNRNSNENSHVKTVINGFYFESEGCHTREKVEPGMNAEQIAECLSPAGVQDVSYVGFQNGPENGWYAYGTGPETRHESEQRAARFYVWMMEFLDEQLMEAERSEVEDIFDAGVTLPGEENDKCHNRFEPRARRRRTAIFCGHGDFMSLVLKRIISGFGHAIEREGESHRSAFVHFNTGITELEYFGKGRFLLMSSNQVPHLHGPSGECCITGGSLKDGWSYLMPSDKILLDSEVAFAFSDDVQPHIAEQTEALRSLYLTKSGSSLSQDELDTTHHKSNALTVVVKRGLQVVGCASLDERTGRLSDVVVRPSARRSQVGRSLIDAVKNHAIQSQKFDKIIVEPDTSESKAFFEKMGFELTEDSTDEKYTSEIVHMECKL